MFKVSVTNDKGNTLSLKPNTNYEIIKIDGLNPPPANINLTSISGMDGSKLNGAKVPNRNIVIYIIPNFPIEENRINLYNYFKSGRTCRIDFKNESMDVYINGTVESVEGTLFTNKQQIQVSIMCEQPYFKGNDKFIAEISQIKKNFSFPFSIEEGGMELSTYNDKRVSEIESKSNIDTGILINIYANNTVVNPCVWNSSTKEFIKANVTMNQYDTLKINTVKGEKYIRLVKKGETTYTNLINSKGISSTWLQLQAGMNTFTCTADSGLDDAVINIESECYYEGV